MKEFIKHSMLHSDQTFSKRFLRVKRYISRLQKVICHGLENVADVSFNEIKWKHREKGGGTSLLVETDPLIRYPHRTTTSKSNIPIFEKGGVNISAVGGCLPQSMAKVLKSRSKMFSACGLSLVIHPYSPRIPTIHMNVRYFEMSNGDSWFGGGVDLTPYYPDLDSFYHFHHTVFKAIFDVYPDRYQEFKENCDAYFTLPHRDEMRGIGGVFFDYLKNNYERDFDLIRSLGDAFLDCYLPIVKKNLKKRINNRERLFQLYRRGRYIEFNLLYDRGTSFGLKTGGRVDSILMSLPTIAYFPINPFYSTNGFEQEMKKYYKPRKWIKRQK